MGKSPAKWIKAVLLGKKSSKTSLSKNGTIERKAACKASAGDPVPMVSDPHCEVTDRGGEKIERGNGTTTSVPCDVSAPFPVKESVDLLASTGLDVADGAQVARQEQAATKAQAAFRGYLARRAFWALKGIIRLQALIRGHLVRRQAVSTLYCMQAIVKFQALARGRKVRILYCGLQMLGKYRVDETKDTKRVDLGANTSQKLATNKFARKLLASLPTAMPLSLQYDLYEPNSAWNWLERWSLLCFWQPLPQPKRILETKSQSKQASSPASEPHTGRSRRTVRKAPMGSNSDNNASNSSEIEKPKRYLRKIISSQTEPVQEQAVNELERVKRSLRKVSASTMIASEKSELETEKAQEGPKSMSNFAALNVSDQGGVNSSEKLNVLPVPVYKPSHSEGILETSSTEASSKLYSTETPLKLSSTEAPSKLSRTEAPSKPSLTEDPSELSSIEAPPKLSVTEARSETFTLDQVVDVIQEEHPVEKNYSDDSGQVEKGPAANSELSSKGDQTSKENQKSRRRRSLPAKQEYPENVSQNTPSLPSYMAATESAKAKLRAQSPKFSEDGNVTENGFVRRHSLPSSTSSKVASLSPRMHRPLQANGKGGNKSSKALSSSKDDKVLQPGWRR